MCVMCCNSHKDKTCWKVILLLHIEQRDNNITLIIWILEKKVIRNRGKKMKPAPIIKQGRIKGSSKKFWSSKTFISRPISNIQDLHLSANRLFKILYISSTFTNTLSNTLNNTTILFVSINFAVLWNAWFSMIFWKIHWSNVFFFFHLVLKIKTFFSYFFISMLQTTNLFFA